MSRLAKALGYDLEISLVPKDTALRFYTPDHPGGPSGLGNNGIVPSVPVSRDWLIITGSRTALSAVSLRSIPQRRSEKEKCHEAI
jgi:hypothetical protein